MRPPTHDDPNAIPRNGTEVPWPELQELGPRRTDAAEREATAREATARGGAATEEAQRHR